MKFVKIIYHSLFNEAILNLMKELNIREYVDCQRICAEDEDGKHLGTRYWPETDCILSAPVSDEKAEELFTHPHPHSPRGKSRVRMSRFVRGEGEIYTRNEFGERAKGAGYSLLSCEECKKRDYPLLARFLIITSSTISPHAMHLHP